MVTIRKRWDITHGIYILWSNALSHKCLCCSNHIWTTISEQNHYLHPKNKEKVKWYFSFGREREFLFVGVKWKHKLMAKQTISLLPVSFVILFQKSESSVFFFPITWYDHWVTLLKIWKIGIKITWTLLLQQEKGWPIRTLQPKNIRSLGINTFRHKKVPQPRRDSGGNLLTHTSTFSLIHIHIYTSSFFVNIHI